MLTLHHLNNSRSQRIIWLLEELGVEYEIKPYQRDPDTQRAPAELKAVHQLGKSPVLEDDGLIIAETGAIIVTSSTNLATVNYVLKRERRNM